MKADVIQKYERIVELEGDIRNKEDESQELEIEFNDIKSHITKLNVDVEGKYLIRRTNSTLWDNISHLFMNEWDHCEVIQEELETYKSCKYKSKRV